MAGSYDSPYMKKGGDMKSTLIYVAGAVATRAPDAMKGDDQDSVEAWASFVKAFDSLCYPIIIGDDKLMAQRKRIRLGVKKFKSLNKEKYFDAYNAWFRLICKSLHKIDAYPEKKIHFVANRGV